MEGAAGHYMGLMAQFEMYGGLAYRPGRSSVSVPRWGTVAHELGHNMSLGHAPCGGPDQVDPAFPYPNGSTGAWGFDFRHGGQLMPPSSNDIMSYCRGQRWISDYHFTRALEYRARDEGAAFDDTLRPLRAVPCCSGAAWIRTACRSWNPRSWSRRRPRYPEPAASIASLAVPTMVGNSSPSPSTCLRWPTVTADRASPSRSPCNQPGQEISPESRCRGLAARPRWTGTPTVPWRSAAIRGPARCAQS